MIKTFFKSIFKKTKSVILGILLILLITFMVNNRDQITLHLFPLPFTIETRLFFIMIVCFLAGFLCALALLSRSMIKNFLHNRKCKKEVQLKKPI